MPKIDLTSHPCNWCGHTEGTFYCVACGKHSCRDCKLGETEEGCIHKKKEVPQTRAWDEFEFLSATYPKMPKYPHSALYYERAPDMRQEARWMDS